MHQEILISFAAIIIFGVSAQWLAWRLQLPSILLLLIFGFIAGPLTGFLNPDELLGESLFPIVSVSVGIILFEGGLGLRRKELRGIGGVVRRLISVGVVVTWFIGSAAAFYLLGLDLALSTLLGAILVVSGPTVVIPLLRHVRPSGRVTSVLKWEGILIDPVGATLAVLVFEELLAGVFAELTLLGLLWEIIITLVVGGVIGAIAAWLLIQLFQRHWVPEYLQTAVTLTVLLGAFAASNVLQAESGLMAATIMGIILANQDRVKIGHIVSFKEELGILLLSVLFILLAARVRPDDLLALGWRGVAFLAVLILVARPLSVLISTFRSDLNWRERLFVAWVAPRGIVAAAVASLFALELTAAGYPGAEQLVPMTFLVVVGTVAIYALSANPLAKRLGLTQENPQGVLIVGAHPCGREIAKALQAAGFLVVLVDTNRSYTRAARLNGLTAITGNVLADDILDQLPLGQIGHMLAMTSNSELNALSALRFTGILGEDHVYQLATTREGAPEDVGRDLRGHTLFVPNLTYEGLSELFTRGAIVKQTSLTGIFNYDTFRAHYGEAAVPMFLVGADETLKVIAAEKDVRPMAGETLISLIDPQNQPEQPLAAIVDGRQETVTAVE